MSWLGLVLLLVGAYLAYKLVGALLKMLMFALALVGAYWFLAPQLGWSTVSDLFYVFGPDFGGRRIEELAAPGELAKIATERVVDGVVERVGGMLPGDAPQADPQPLPGDVDADAVEPLPGDVPGAADQPTR